ncbi:(Fe-S)-binding protein [Granulicella sp. S156]|uniref:(Fe-S)-binding protein n=1 Tax=Granulicella sp. S156 TaxID=1747224 RepID=UPI00131C46EB|nr:(Fe-S)-binding protein [Granulicella sp. S156]
MAAVGFGMRALAGITLAEPLGFSVVEIVVVLLLCAASAAMFLWRLRPIASNIWRSKKDTDFSLRPVGKRVWVFFWEVLCQAKVIRQRPVPGMAHAFVFWGFLAFALVSLNHLATGLHLGFLQHVGFVGTFYFGFAGIWAVLVAVSIAGLFWRRFVTRPKWLGEKVSVESGVIAGLIFVLMVSYLAAFFVADNGLAVQFLWWIHTLALLIFLPLIPHTKHLHLVLSPLTVFLKRNEFSQIPKLEGDEDFGLVAGKDLTQIISLQAYSCVECGRCTEHCPASTTGKVLNPKEIVLGVRSYLNSFGPASETPLLNEMREESANASPDNPIANYLSMEAAFECTTCGACEYQCPVGVEHLPIMVGLRRGAVNTGAWEDRYGTKLFLALEKQGNALGLSALERDKFIAKQEFPIFDGSQEYCLWLGCMGGYDPKGREIIADFARVMRYLGTSFGVLKKEKCTGDPARRLGNDLVFGSLAETGLKAFEQAKVKKIVAICPHCVRTIATDWREYGIAPEIEHHSEFMARYADRLPKQNGESIVYHDPCYLGRYRDVYEEPRVVVAAAGELVEAERNHERSFCCGAGGGLAFLGEETGDRVSHVRAKELVATGAQTIGTACPFCNTMFRDALGAVGGEQPPQLLDIAQLTARAL